MKADEIGPQHTEALAVSVLASTLWLLYRASERSNSSFWTAYSVAGLAIQLYLLNVRSVGSDARAIKWTRR